MGRRPKPKLMLWWCWTEDHHEDWFVVAGRGSRAAGFFESEEGHAEGDVHAEGLLVLPEECQDDKHVGWPSHELLLACGGKLIREETPRVVELEGRRYGAQLIARRSPPPSRHGTERARSRLRTRRHGIGRCAGVGASGS